MDTSNGSVTVGYSVGGCSATMPVDVSGVYVYGSDFVCVGGTTTLSGYWGGGTYNIISGGANATVDVFTGVVTGLHPGSFTINYHVEVV